MKILITENRVQEIVFHWLDTNYGGIKKLVANKEEVWFMNDGKIIFQTDPSNKNYLDFIEPEVGRFLHLMFGLRYEALREVILQWLKSRKKL